MSRRLLLAGLGAGAIGAVAAAAPTLSLGSGDGDSGERASWWGRTFLSLQSAGLAEWSGVVGETFTLDGANMLRVAAVTAFARSGPRPADLGRSQAFSVEFESIAGPPLPATDRLYKLVHPSYPPIPIYMGAPVGLGRTTRLIAVFN